MSIKINNQNIVALYKGEQSIAYVYKGTDLVWQLELDPLDEYIYFADPEVGRVLHENGLIASPTHSTRKKLATITTLNPSGTNTGSYFYDNKVITQFPELQYFTGLTNLRSTFRDCSNLTTVVIPSSVTNMESTFSSCTSLIKAPNIPSSVTSLAFTFFKCSNLTTASVIPEGVTDLTATFNYCSSLIEAPIIPSSVTILSATFNGCSSINGIYIINPVTPPDMYYTDNLFNVRAIYVPDESVQLYREAHGWTKFAYTIRPMSSKPQ